MAVTSRNLQRRAPPQLEVSPPLAAQPQHARGQFAQHILPAVTLLLLGVALVAVFDHGRTWLHDVRYGRPRTTYLRAAIGQGDSAAQPTDFVALNLNRRVIVLALPGGDPSQAYLLEGPYLFGAAEDLTPITLHAEDRNGDGQADLTITIKNEELIYLSTGATFRLLSDAEREAITEAQP